MRAGDELEARVSEAELTRVRTRKIGTLRKHLTRVQECVRDSSSAGAAPLTRADVCERRAKIFTSTSHAAKGGDKATGNPEVITIDEQVSERH